jgi:hypothetical protein
VFNSIWVGSVDVWSLTLREERRLWVFENRVFRRILEPKRDEVKGKVPWWGPSALQPYRLIVL